MENLLQARGGLSSEDVVESTVSWNMDDRTDWGCHPVDSQPEKSRSDCKEGGHCEVAVLAVALQHYYLNLDYSSCVVHFDRRDLL